MELFQIALLKSSVIEFSKVLGCILQSFIMLESDSTRDNYLKAKVSSQKSMRWIPVLVVTCDICKNRLIVKGYCENIMFIACLQF